MSASRPAMSADAPSDASLPDIVARIGAFMQGFSLEATRPSASDVAALAATLAPATRVYLSAIPGRPERELVDAARLVRAAGFEPVPHLAVRNFSSTGALEDFLAHAAQAAALRCVLVIAGDREQPAGPFLSAFEVIDSGLLQRYGIAEVGIAGYPDGHPRIASDTLDRALAAKVEAAEQTGLGIHIVTQFCFEAATIRRWLVRLRDLGI